MRCDHEFRIAEQAFAACSSPTLGVDQIFTCAHIAPAPDGPAKMRAVLDSGTAFRELLAARREILLKQYTSAQAHYAASDVTEAMGGTFGGLPMIAAFSAHYYKAMFESHTSIVEQLNGFKGRTKSLFGEFDHMFPELEEPALKNAQGTLVPIADTIFIPGVGHGLEDKSVYPSAPALAAIVHALGEVMKK